VIKIKKQGKTKKEIKGIQPRKKTKEGTQGCQDRKRVDSKVLIGTHRSPWTKGRNGSKEETEQITRKTQRKKKA
jgi:hypothetical protein